MTRYLVVRYEVWNTRHTFPHTCQPHTCVHYTTHQPHTCIYCATHMTHVYVNINYACTGHKYVYTIYTCATYVCVLYCTHINCMYMYIILHAYKSHKPYYCIRTISSIMLDGETLEPTTFIFIHIILEMLFNKVRGKFKSEFYTLIRQNQFLFLDDMIIYLKTPTKSVVKPLRNNQNTG